MKKIIIALVLCIVSTMGFGQSEYISDSKIHGWDYIWYIIPDGKNYRETTYKEYIEMYNDEDYVNLRKRIYMPSESVLHNYNIGSDCYTSGKVFISVGCATSLVGGILLGSGNRKAGCALLGVGGAFISVSIPLLCFGDHIKRECNMIVGK